MKDWINKIHCGDALSVLKEMPDHLVDFCFYDPPYNVGKQYENYSDNLPEDEYLKWMKNIITEVRRISNTFAIYPPKIHLRKIWNMCPELHLIICAWSPEGAIRGKYVHQYIPILAPKEPLKRTKDHWWNVQVPGLGYFYREEKFGNPGQTSLDITTRIIDAFTLEGQIALDCFMGIGTTAVACERLKRNWIGIEISPEYCKIAETRIKKERDQFKLAL